ncbi:maleylpyruvate isomerase family mycothiol-dependent enzyme [Actinomycetospora lutea]|uniref:maleylpyruvate isomerase family mycothiol-dependent enzyme n=1 Tax=Actinomycetospora lutea TaxID=663604 RepID=UPI0023657F39|nr:maleylpyruvate isomerase family mycothiol-dependent enzyme [Actinomycetospora lutea]MDD7938445.1 maleylpyruvate isomerase family mycothiol-dependent enzyme [Actinomycetospora lutea]
MDDADLHTAIESERLRLADVLDELAPEEWAYATLCTGWNVKTLVAHLTLTSRLSRPAALRGVVAARFDINAFIDRAARARAAQYSVPELIAQFRQSAGWTRRPMGAKPMDPFVDIQVHGQDLTRPLRRPLPMAPDHAVPALEFVLSTSFYGAPKRVAGLRLVATDTEWSHGTGGREVRGPAGDLLLVATGRPAGLAALDGDGVADLAARL